MFFYDIHITIQTYGIINTYTLKSSLNIELFYDIRWLSVTPVIKTLEISLHGIRSPAAAATFYFYKYFWSMLWSQALETPQPAPKPPRPSPEPSPEPYRSWPALHKASRNLLRNLRTVEPALPLLQTLPDLHQNLLRNGSATKPPRPCPEPSAEPVEPASPESFSGTFSETHRVNLIWFSTKASQT